MGTLIFLCMLFGHVINDYYLQGCLADLKQRDWWRKQVDKNFPGVPFRQSMYSSDYKTALLAHGFSWSFTCMLPLIWMFWRACPGRLSAAILVNAVFHAWVDDLKANRHSISLEQDQLLHVAQLALTAVAFLVWL